MPTAHSSPPQWQHERRYAKVPIWLIRSEHLSHAQYRILNVLLVVLGGRRGEWWHVSYSKLAEWASTDSNTVTIAVKLFVDQGWIEVKGGRNWRLYKLHREAIESSLWALYGDEYDEEDEAG